MSEPMFPSPDASPAAPAVAPAVESGTNRKTLLALGGVGAALIVGAGAFFLLNSGGGSDPAPVAAGIPTQAAPSVAPTPAASPSAKPTVIRPASVSVSARDPFKVLFAPKPAATAAPSTAPTTAPTTAPVPTPTPVTPSITLAVSKINTVKQTATITVDGKPYAASIGSPFATNFVMYSVFNSQCVGILFGDQSVPVCTNAPQTVSP